MPRPPFLEVLPTRVRRNYTGGALLGRWTVSAAGESVDGHEPEDWIASTVEAKNPGLPPREREGLTRVRRPDGTESELRAELSLEPEHLVGASHLRAHGQEIGFLAKLLDSAIRLHIQAHPTAAFSRQYLNSPYGKLEAYVILGARDGCDPYVLLGFKNAPTPAEWRRIIAGQDVAGMESRLHRLPVKPGEVWLVPGGLPHAIGEGVLMLEIMEPSDWVVRCEFLREGIAVPPAGRFMGRDLDFCLGIFDYRSYREEEILAKCRLTPRVITQSENGIAEELVGPAHTGCFAVRRLRASGPAPVPASDRFRLMLVTAGTGTLHAGSFKQSLQPGSRFLFPAGSNDCRLVPAPGVPLEALFCLPG